MVTMPLGRRRATLMLTLLLGALVGCSPAPRAPGTPISEAAKHAPPSVEVGSGIVTPDALTLSFEVSEPLSCEVAAPATGWPSFCVLVTSDAGASGADAYALAGHLVYRAELTYIDAEEVWVRPYDGALQWTGGQPQPAGAAAFARMTLSNPAGFASPGAAKDHGTLSVTLNTLDGLAPGTRLTVFLVGGSPPESGAGHERGS